MIYIVCDYNDSNTSRLSDDHFPKSSVEIIMQEINSIGYKCKYFGGINELADTYTKKATFDDSTLFLNLSDGLFQNSRRMQAPVLLDLLGVKYSGSTPFAVGLMNNKYFSKLSAEKCGVHVPNGILIHSNLTSKQTELEISNITYPLIIKPNGEGSSLGIDNNSIVYNYQEAILQLNKLKNKYDDIIIEQFIPGTDASTLIVGNKNDFRILETLIYKTNNQFVLSNSVRDTYVKENWISEGFIVDCLPEYANLSTEFKSISRTIFEYIGCCDIARIDYRISTSGEIYFLEINSMPTITPTSDAGMICKCLKKPYKEFLKEYIDTAYSKYNA